MVQITKTSVEVLDPRLNSRTFSEDLMDQIFVRTHTGDLRAGTIGTDYVLTIGNVTFKDPDRDKVWSKGFEFLNQLAEPTQEVRDRMALLGDDPDTDAETTALIDVLTEGGLTDLGRLTIEYRQRRNETIRTAFAKFVDSPQYPAQDPTEFLDYMTTESGLQDLTLEEIRDATMVEA
jgi:hypothetical protein